MQFVRPINWSGLIKGTASTMMIVAAVLISSSPYLAAESALVYCIFLGVHVIWASYAVVMKEYSLLWMNLGLLPVDFYAIGIRI